MKIAVATEDGNTISAHFGRSPYFAIYEIENDQIVNKEKRQNTFTGHFSGGQHREHSQHGHGRGDAQGHQTVAEGLKDCTTVISHGMGLKAWEDLRAKGIEMIVTDETDIENAIEMYLAGELEDKTEKLH